LFDGNNRCTIIFFSLWKCYKWTKISLDWCAVVSNNPIEQCFVDAYDYFYIKNKEKENEIKDNDIVENESFYTLSLGAGFYDIILFKQN
jgi:hypothetical protein